ncbi:MAG TPA: hypothetical protein VH681_14870 [Nitrospiraceae bacterium]
MIPNKMHLKERLREILTTEFPINQGSISADGTIINWVVGVIHSQSMGLIRAGIRIKVMERSNLRVRWQIGVDRCFLAGQRVCALIPAEAVRLEAGIFRRSQQRWNRWIGRIVLVESSEDKTLYTVKIHGEDWTLKAYDPVVGARQPMKSWDTVNVVVDPQHIDVRATKSMSHEADLMLDS